ncbi:uncharacterized protein [Apostichopus japonicus]|uniref:uncharacterized protein isoform X3 n=1 Tax=Stichopus japonicus TaxID=307972 RepID=UPI003AB75E05
MVMVNLNYSVLRSAFLGIYQFHIRSTALGRNVYSLHEQGKCGLMISLMTIVGGHMMRILHRMVYNMLMVMVIQLSTFLLYISSKKLKEKLKWEHITDDITSFVDESLVSLHIIISQKSVCEMVIVCVGYPLIKSTGHM